MWAALGRRGRVVEHDEIEDGTEDRNQRTTLLAIPIAIVAVNAKCESVMTAHVAAATCE